jgi:hypothetical protein
MRKMEDEVHPKGFGCKRAEITNLLLQQERRAQLRLQNPESAGVAYSGYELRSCEIRSHGRDHNRRVDAKPLTKARF